MTADVQVVEEARSILGASERNANGQGPAPSLREMRYALRSLLALVDRYGTRSVRRSVQADEEFVNLARAARSELHAAQGALRRLSGFEQALTRIVSPEGGA